MENGAKVDFVESEFGVCVINWEIENYGYAAHGMEYELQSPCFEVKPYSYLWRLALKSDQGLCDDTEMLFSLERRDSTSDTVWVSYDVSLIDQNKKKWKGAQGEHHFKPNDKHCSNVPNIYYGRVNVSAYNFQFMTVRCQMIVTYGKKHNFSDSLIDSGLKVLSQDMEKLYKSAKFTDVKLKFDNNSESVAHKAVLSVRNKYTRDKFIEGTSLLNCSSLNSDAMQKILRYIYTGDIVDVVDNPSISVYNCINFLFIEELKIHFKANEIKVNSSIEVYQTGLIWRIENFRTRTEKCIESDLICCDLLEMVWKLSLYPKGVDEDSEYLTVIAENVEGKIEGNVWAKVEIYSDPLCRTWKTMKEVKQGEIFEILNLEDSKSALEKLEDGTLRIGFKACVSVDVTHSLIYGGMNAIHRSTPFEDSYKKLSNDIFRLRKDATFSDVVIVSQGESFNAHKCILSARSSKFGELLGDEFKDRKIHIENIKPEIIDIILDYIYSGVMGDSYDLSVIIEVYKAASKVGANYLQRDCSKYLRKSIDAANALKISKLACDQNDPDLEKEAFEFIKNNLGSFYEATSKSEKRTKKA